MKLKIWIAVLSFLTVVNLAALGTLLLTGPPGAPDPVRGSGFGRRGGGERGPHFRLPPEEREQMRQLMDGFRTDTKDLRERADHLEDQLVDLMAADDVNREAIDTLLLDLSQVRLEIGRKATENLIEAKQFLSPRQQEMFYRAVLGVRRMGQGTGGPPDGKRRRR